MEIAKAVAGFTPAEADDLRKAIGKKVASLMASLKEKFIDGLRPQRRRPRRWGGRCGPRSRSPPTTPSTRPTPPATR